MIALLALLLHGDSVSSSRIEVSGREAVVTFTFDKEDLAGLAREWTRVLPAISSYLANRFQIDGCRAGGDLEIVPTATTPVVLRMRYVSDRPLDRLRIRCTLFHEHEGNPRHVAEGPGGRLTVFDRERVMEDVRLQPSSTPFLMLLGLGAAAAVAAVILMGRA